MNLIRGLLLSLAIFVPGIYGQADLSVLAGAIQNGAAETKRDALFAIRNLRSEDASRVAVPALRDRNVLVRATATSAVVFLPAAEAASLLIPMLDDRDEFVRREAAFALGSVADVSAVPALARAMRRQRGIEVRSAAAIALGEIGDASAIGPLTAVLQARPREDDEFVRRSAARSIGQIAQFRRTGLRRVVTPQNFLREKYKIIDGGTMDAQFRPSAAVLLNVLESSRESADTRREAAFALGAIGDRSALPALERASAGSDPYLAEISREAVLKITAVSN